MRLLKREVDKLAWDPSGPAQQIAFDEELPGFGLRVFPTGAKSFVLWYRTGKGRSRLITIGRFGPMTVQQARERAQRMVVAVRDGADPIEVRRAERQGLTVRQFAELYIDRHAKRRKRTWLADRKRIERHILPAFGSRKFDAITRREVAALHSKIGETAPYEANRVLALLKVMFNLAGEWGHIPESTPNPARIKMLEERSRDRWVKPEELPALMEAIAAEESPHVRAAVQLALLTGMRRGELLALRWQDVDLRRREVLLVDTKAKRSHLVPLSPTAVQILEDLPRMLGNPHVFPSPVVPGSHLHDLKNPWERVRARAGMPDLRFHDLRRTVGSWLATSGASLPLIGKVLNHSSAKTTQVYARLTEQGPRIALDNLAEQMRAAVEIA